MKSRTVGCINGILFVVFCALTALPANAQVFGENLKVFVGYSNIQAEGLANRNTNLPDVLNTSFFQDRSTLHGGNVEVTGAVKGIGLTADASFNRNHQGTDVTGGHNIFSQDLAYFMAGPSFSYAGHGKVE